MISIGFKTDKGLTRQDNEDAVFVLPDRNLYMVADGVGGQNNGELASRTAVGYMAQFAALHPVAMVREGAALKQYFMSLLSGANELIFGKAYSEPGSTGMATTAVICYLRDDTAYVVNVGDSRAYLLRDGELTQVTEDHSMVADMVRKGVLTEEQAACHPMRNYITRAVGTEENIEIDISVHDRKNHDRWLICSDGMYGMVPKNELLQLMSTDNLEEAATRMLQAALDGGGKDNITIVLVDDKTVFESEQKTDQIKNMSHEGNDTSDFSTI